MFDKEDAMIKKKEEDAIKLLKEDHKKVKDLFEQFEDSDDNEEKKEIALKACAELKVHAQIEEEILYPAADKELEDEELVAEAHEEHHVAKQLIEELETGDLEPTVFNAKFTVLAENVRHHIKEEEGELFPEMKDADVDMEKIGTQLAARKNQLEPEAAAQLVAR